MSRHIEFLDLSKSDRKYQITLPILLDTWKDSIVIQDINGVHFLATAGYRRSKRNYILKFSPGSINEDGTYPSEGCCFNPLDAVRVGTPFDVKDAMNIARLILSRDYEYAPGFDRRPPFAVPEDHWHRCALSLLTGVILHVLYAMPDKTLRGVAAYLNDPTLESVDIAF
ncbi:type IV secretory system conjugative DNA transfer family protein, partial [Candidatus Igneacidithiobacillus taiwanensis]|uniref:type IV secretory system conjugative DNA transfer family protein n=1 Tax=Candidatus Igneacidithiobacillus taiwanensis TaxID=1945924 RepID=UPI002897A633